MKPLLVVLCALSLSGCAGFNDRAYGSWLDSVGRSVARGQLSEETVKSLQARALQLRSESESVRIQLSHEGDRVRRIAYLRKLEAIGDELRPIEQALRDGGYPPPSQPYPPAAAA